MINQVLTKGINTKEVSENEITVDSL